ncbi:LysR family transcriptional regulator [Lonsdalea quercina]|uniref:LysR family transcriptional regulator n=1 Tax=Lonsdalea quercina TaxID=71657 RepID=UPI0039757ABE
MIFSKKVEHFIVISELGSFKAAAERIHVTPPALSKSISDLEDSLGYRLFNRSNSGINLTKEGDLFYRQLLPVRERLENITKLVTKNTRFFRELKISTDTYNDSFYKIIFSDSIKKGINLLCMQHSYAEFKNKLLSEEIDFFISSSPKYVDSFERIACIAFMNDSCILISSQNVIDKYEDIMDLVVEEDLVVHSSMLPHPILEKTIQHRRMANTRARVHVFPDFSHVIEYLAVDKGYSFSCSSFMNFEISRHIPLATRPLFLNQPAEVSYIYYLKRKEDELHHFIQLIRECHNAP